MSKYRGFTLAEVMIVLTVIGILAGILIPVANNSRPDENVMKFKKAHATLANVVHELVTNDKYYADGDLGKKPDGNLIDNGAYLCLSMTEVLNVKQTNCITSTNDYNTVGKLASFNLKEANDLGINMKNNVDTICKMLSTGTIASLTTSDKITYYDPAPGYHFGLSEKQWHSGNDSYTLDRSIRYFGDIEDSNNLDTMYKIFCIDIDKIEEGEPPFGYGIRADGKMYTGARADEWLEKGFQKGKNDN